MKVLIDTNIYLNFYRQSKQPDSLITSLIDLIESHKIELILPKQIEDEFFRNKEGISLEFIKNLAEELTMDHVDSWSKDDRTEFSNAELRCCPCNIKKETRVRYG